MQTDDGSDDITNPHAPLLDNREGVITRPKSAPKFYVLRILVIYGIFNFYYHLLTNALLILPVFSSPHAPDRYIPPSLPPWFYIIGVTLTAGLWLRLASPSAWGPKHVMMISIAGMFIFAIAVLIYLQYFVKSYSATCIVHLLNGLLGGNLVFVALVYAQLVEVITRPLSRFAIFSFVMGNDQGPAWIVCLLIPVIHIALVHVILPDSQVRLHADHTWKRIDKVVATPLAVLITPKRLLVLSSALVIYTMTQSFTLVKAMLVLARRPVEGQPFPYLFFMISPLATLVLFLVLLPGGTFVYMHKTTRKPPLTAQYRFVKLFATWSLLFDIVSFIVVPILVLTTSSETMPLVVAGLSALTEGVRPALYVLVSVVPSAQLFGGVKILEIVARQISFEVIARKMPWQKIGEKDEKGLLVICGVLVVVLAIVIGLVNYASAVDKAPTGQSGPDVEDEETSALAPPAAVEDRT
ncbi:hypothetical protein BDZ89DRAFT_1068135 [Hymenopellis radicata]|nr:hypothetical protein BDZ89DRAFT_1068135 [Hymenopellis radicata]